jgi:hypothetical protein
VKYNIAACWHRVDSAAGKGMAASKASQRQGQPATQAVSVKSFDRVFAARRTELAAPHEMRADQALIAANDEYNDGRHR